LSEGANSFEENDIEIEEYYANDIRQSHVEKV
jgi:hypothetical protein